MFYKKIRSVEEQSIFVFVITTIKLRGKKREKEMVVSSVGLALSTQGSAGLVLSTAY